jgi:hypothetical protein
VSRRPSAPRILSSEVVSRDPNYLQSARARDSTQCDLVRQFRDSVRGGEKRNARVASKVRTGLLGSIS